ncbi:MAG: murein transglycosylase [Glaciihabitans sp.]|nr:murein transglycosylase [Glaciihabitans sp.]
MAAWIGIAAFTAQTEVVDNSAALVNAEAIATGPISPADIISNAATLDTGSAASTTTPDDAVGIAATVSQDWVTRVAASTGIPERALAAYAGASLVLATENSACNLGWTTLAAIGKIESGHASHGGAVLQPDGYSSPAIVGPALDGGTFMGISDTDGGAWDGDTQWDRAVGPLQFIPETWSYWGADGNGDGEANPNQIDDAALAAGRYLCHSGNMSSVEGWRSAIFSYNHDNKYVDSIAEAANRYATASTA